MHQVARCCTRTKAIPGSISAGMPEKKASKAASPPAETPIPTMGKPAQVFHSSLVSRLSHMVIISDSVTTQAIGGNHDDSRKNA